MKRFALLLVFLLGIPGSGIVTSALVPVQQSGLLSISAGRWPADSQRITLSTALTAQTITAPEACQDQALRAGNKQLCHERDTLFGLMIGSAVCAGVSVAFLAAISAPALIARGNQRRPALLFGVGRRLVLVVLGILVIAQGFIATVTVAALANAALGTVPAVLVLSILLGSLAGAFITIRESAALTRPRRISELAVAIARAEQPRLWASVIDIARRLNTAQPRNLILSLQPKFYGTGSEVTVVNRSDVMRGETLCLSLPMMRIMTSLELAAVIRHELGHFRGQDLAYNLHFAPV